MFTAATTHHIPRTLVRAPELLTDFRTRAAYSEGAGIYRIVPAAVAVPHGVEELQRLGGWAADSGTHLVPRGAGSGMAGGSVGRDVVVDMSQGFRWTAPDWSRRTLWAGAAVTWGDVTDAARPFGLRLPPDPSSGAFATSGGMVATNAAGPRSVRCGSVRHWVEAIEIIDAAVAPRRVTRGAGSGERYALSPDQRRLVAARFPKTRKNSAGYALNHFADSGDELDLLIGSEGTLAFVTAVQWRLEPIPADAAGVALGFRTLEQVTEAVPYLVALNPSAVELLDRTLLDFVRPTGVDLPEGSRAARSYAARLRSSHGRRPARRPREPAARGIRARDPGGGAWRGGRRGPGPRGQHGTCGHRRGPGRPRAPVGGAPARESRPGPAPRNAALAPGRRGWLRAARAAERLRRGDPGGRDTARHPDSGLRPRGRWPRPRQHPPRCDSPRLERRAGGAVPRRRRAVARSGRHAERRARRGPVAGWIAGALLRARGGGAVSRRQAGLRCGLDPQSRCYYPLGRLGAARRPESRTGGDPDTGRHRRPATRDRADRRLGDSEARPGEPLAPRPESRAPHGNLPSPPRHPHRPPGVRRARAPAGAVAGRRLVRGAARGVRGAHLLHEPAQPGAPIDG